MDDFSFQGEVLHKTLLGLTTINKFLGNSNVMLACLKPILQNSKTTLKLVDLGCGGADLLKALAKFSQKNNIDIQLFGIDGNPNIIQYAKDQNSGYPNIKFLCADILDPKFELPSCDILISSHFMYHFTDVALSQFLHKHKSKVDKYIIISELQRSKLSFFLFKLLAKIFKFPKIIRSDGLKAISRSFHKKELDSILDKAELTNYKIRWKWAFRYLIIILLQD